MIDDAAHTRDYAAIEAAVMETALGRWFLAEHACRHRAADTERVLAAIAGLEASGLRSSAASDVAAEPSAESAARALVLRRIGQIGGALAGLAAEIEALRAMLATSETNMPASIPAAPSAPPVLPASATAPDATAAPAPAVEAARRRLDAFDALPAEERLRLFY